MEIFIKVRPEKQLPLLGISFIEIYKSGLQCWTTRTWKSDSEYLNLLMQRGVEFWLKEITLPTKEEINEKWEERNSSGTYLEGNMNRREGAKYIIDQILKS